MLCSGSFVFKVPFDVHKRCHRFLCWSYVGRCTVIGSSHHVISEKQLRVGTDGTDRERTDRDRGHTDTQSRDRERIDTQRGHTQREDKQRQRTDRERGQTERGQPEREDKQRQRTDRERGQTERERTDRERTEETERAQSCFTCITSSRTGFFVHWMLDRAQRPKLAVLSLDEPGSEDRQCFPSADWLWSCRPFDQCRLSTLSGTLPAQPHQQLLQQSLQSKISKDGLRSKKKMEQKPPEEKMRQIEGEFRKIADGVREIQEGAGRVITAGAVAGGLGLGATVGLGILVVAAWFTGGVSLAVGLLAVAVGLLAGGGTVARGAAVVFGGNVTKAMKENGSAKKVEELGKEFMEMVEPLKNNLEKIKKTCEKLEDRSAELQAGKTLTDMEDFQRILGQVPELAPSSGVVWSKKLGNTIIQSADLCQK
ncbi:hypothetical protein FQN60_007279, partial [Etheostoma spectabile]